MGRSLPPLPIDDVLPAVIENLRRTSAVVVCAPPGAGKTTRVPPAILDAGLSDDGVILVLQPRRVAARATAARMSAERGTALGEEIGYRVRFESRVSRRTRIEVVTEGILLRRLLSDSFLEHVSCVVFDEFHERSLSSDLALGMIRQLRDVRPELKVVVMSATLSAEPISAYLGGAPIIISDGRMFPVSVRYQPDLNRRPMEDAAAGALEPLLEETSGDCLIFLPGVGEIRGTARRLAGLAERHSFNLLELYGDLSPEQQDRVLAPSAERKVILATNVAETSLTIEGVTAVIDSGLARISRFDENTGLDRLELGPISQASAAQRAGRAGRTQPGICVRLWPEAAQRSRPEFETPEIRRVDLSAGLLQLMGWIEPVIERFPWFERPTATALERGQNLLRRLGASENGAITDLGRRMASLPIHPRLARLLLEGTRTGAAERAATAAALLSERDPFVRAERRSFQHVSGRAGSESDVLDRVEAIEEYSARGSLESAAGILDARQAKHILRTRDQLLRLLSDNSRETAGPAHDAALLNAIAAAYSDRIARRREPHSPRGVLVGGRGVRLTADSAVREAEFFACIELDGGAEEAQVRQASKVDRESLQRSLIRTETAVEFDQATEKVIARKRTWYETLLLEERPVGLPEHDEPARILASAAAQHWDRVFPQISEAAANWIARCRCLAGWLPELELPPLDDVQLQSLLPQLAAGRRSFAELRTAPWLDAVKGLMTYSQVRTVEDEAPERIEVPSGSRIAIHYEPGKPPVLAVRIQEVFGWAETPRIARRRVPLLLHLLAPNMRPEQITADLAGFWRNTYVQVRKDLRGRYPKHAWPDDPLHALAQRRPTRRPPA